MDTLRWILLLAGLAIIAGVYFSGRRSRRNIIDEISSAEPTAPLERDEPRREVRRRHPDVDDVEHELSQLSNLIAENRRSPVAAPERKPVVVPTVTTPAPAKRAATVTAPEKDPDAAPDVTPPPKPEPEAGEIVPPPAPPAPPLEDKLIVIYIMAPPGGRFAGKDVRDAVETAGLTHGSMDIFHRLADPDNSASDAVFSLANSVEPGTFKLNALDDFSTPGLTLFMQLPGPLNGITALDSMLAAAHIIATELHGELRDQTRSVLSKQSIEKMHHEIIEYQRRQRLARATP